MHMNCPACDVECTVDVESVESATCPACGALLQTNIATPPGAGPIDGREETSQWNPTEAERLLSDGGLPCRIGRYLVQSVLARGGFARVYLATDEELDRPVALKLPRRDRYSDRRKLTAVIHEAKTAARLRHPGVVTIYDAGYLVDGTPFIAMEFVAGRTLRELLLREYLPPTRCAELLAAVAEAAHYAHGQGLVHRDLKPANVLIDERGQPKIVDFGLAVHESRQALLDGDVSGTPAYMAPEQVRGEAHRMDGRTDVWSLGVILYEMLTGRRPFSGDASHVFDEIQHREPKPPRQIDDRIPRQLEDISLKCLSKSIAGRYSTSLDVAEALRSWLKTAPPEPQLVNSSESESSISHATTRSGYSGPTVVEKQQGSAAPWLFAGSLFVAAVGLGLFYLNGLLSGHRDAAADADKTSFSFPALASSGAAPAVKANKWLPNRWYPLLDHEPEVLLWPEQTQDSSWRYNAERQELMVTSSQPSMFTLVDINSSDYRLEVRIVKNTWLGNSGVIWGVHDGKADDGTPSLRCQACFLHSYLSGPAAKHRLNRDFLEFWRAPGTRSTGMARHQFLAERLEPPDGPEMHLELTVIAGHVQNIAWHGQPLTGMCDGPALKPPRPLVSNGRLGLFNEEGTTIFRDARIQLLDAQHSGK